METSQQVVYERIKANLKAHVTQLVSDLAQGDPAGVHVMVLKERVRQMLRTLPAQEYRALHISRAREEDQLLQEVVDGALGPGLLEGLLADPTISEIMVNGPDEIFVEQAGRLRRLELHFRDTPHLMAVLERMLDTVGLAVNESNPICDAHLPDGSRLNVIIPPLVLNGPVVTIRRKLPLWTLQKYVAREALSPEAAEFLAACVKAKVNVIVSGGTSTGKTSLVEVLSSFIPQDERVITMESVAELELPNRQHWIRLVSRSHNLDGRGEVPLRTLVRNALRMRPDRIILGEARGGEALDVVQAMHTGHEGVITVLHANSPQAALERLETLMLMSGLDLPPHVCRAQIASAVDLVVHMMRSSDGNRRVAVIAQVMGASPQGFALEELFTFEVQSFSPAGQLQGVCRYTGAQLKFRAKFQLNNVPVPAWLAI